MQSFKVFLLCSVFGLFGSSTQIFSQQLPSYVETRMGKFPLEIPALILPELQPLRLASVPDPAFPELPLWHLEPSQLKSQSAKVCTHGYDFTLKNENSCKTPVHPHQCTSVLVEIMLKLFR